LLIKVYPDENFGKGGNIECAMIKWGRRNPDVIGDNESLKKLGQFIDGKNQILLVKGHIFDVEFGISLLMLFI